MFLFAMATWSTTSVPQSQCWNRNTAGEASSSTPKETPKPMLGRQKGPKIAGGEGVVMHDPCEACTAACTECFKRRCLRWSWGVVTAGNRVFHLPRETLENSFEWKMRLPAVTASQTRMVTRFILVPFATTS